MRPSDRIQARADQLMLSQADKFAAGGAKGAIARGAARRAKLQAEFLATGTDATLKSNREQRRADARDAQKRRQG